MRRSWKQGNKKALTQHPLTLSLSLSLVCHTVMEKTLTLQQLPPEIIYNILSFLPSSDVTTIASFYCRILRSWTLVLLDERAQQSMLLGWRLMVTDNSKYFTRTQFFFPSTLYSLEPLPPNPLFMMATRNTSKTRNSYVNTRPLTHGL